MTYSNLMKQMLMASIEELSKTPESNRDPGRQGHW